MCVRGITGCACAFCSLQPSLSKRQWTRNLVALDKLWWERATQWTYNLKNNLYMFFGGTLAICVWKCTWGNPPQHTWCKQHVSILQLQWVCLLLNVMYWWHRCSCINWWVQTVGARHHSTSIVVFTVVSWLLVPIAHCNHSRDKSIPTVESHAWLGHQIHMKLHHSNAKIMWVFAVCNVQSGLEIVEQLYIVVRAVHVWVLIEDRFEWLYRCTASWCRAGPWATPTTEHVPRTASLRTHRVVVKF